MLVGLQKSVQHTVSKMLLESGTSLERLAKAMVGDYSYYDHVSQHRTLVGVASLGNPTVAETSKIDASATIVGPVTVGAHAVVAANAIVSGPTTIGDSAEIGAGAVVKAGVTVGPGATVAEGAIVLAGTNVPEGELWAGVPAVFVSPK